MSIKTLFTSLVASAAFASTAFSQFIVPKTTDFEETDFTFGRNVGSTYSENGLDFAGRNGDLGIANETEFLSNGTQSLSTLSGDDTIEITTTSGNPFWINSFDIGEGDLIPQNIRVSAADTEGTERFIDFTTDGLTAGSFFGGSDAGNFQTVTITSSAFGNDFGPMTQFNISSRDSGRIHFIDNINYSIIPEPSSAALIAAAAVGGLAFMRRRPS